jgi:hypothetical protein
VIMAHLFAFTPIEEPNYVNGLKSSKMTKFPSTGMFQGFNLPSRLEGNIFDLEVTGTI